MMPRSREVTSGDKDNVVKNEPVVQSFEQRQFFRLLQQCAEKTECRKY